MLEVIFQVELILPRCVVRIGLRNATKCRVPEAGPTAAVSDEEIRCVGDVETFCAELHRLCASRNRKVLEDREVDVAEVGTEKRIPPVGSNGSE